MSRLRLLAAGLAFSFASPVLSADAPPPVSRVLVVGAKDQYHSPMVEKAKPLFDGIASETGLAIDLTQDPATLTDDNLSRYQAVVQLHLAPFDLSNEQQDALQRFVVRGKGWVGVHAAGLTGRQFLANKDARYWQWFEDFMGGVVYSPHPALQKGTLIVEDRTHPVTRNLPERFEVLDEWYEFDKSPRPNVHVLGRADESSYHQNKPMGDHPLVWTNPAFRRMVYLGIGHDVSMCTDPNFRILMRDAILWAAAAAPRFRALVLAEKIPPHAPFVAAATRWLEDLSRRDGFDVDAVENTDTIDAALLARYQVVVQLNYPPYGWKPAAADAFKAYIQEGRGGWVGFHHATLLGEFDGYPMWPWFWEFMGKVRWKDYIPTFAAGTVHVEDKAHPVMAGVPETFVVDKEEWYTYDRSPRPEVHVLASVDESSYKPDSALKMGDHPVVWTNDHLPARNVYVFMGHGPDLLDNTAFTAIARNAILWAAGGTLEEHFQSTEQALMDSIAVGDKGPWERVMDPSCVVTSEEGEVVARKQFLEELRPLPPGLSGSIAVKDLTVQEFPDFAVVRYLADESETVFGQKLATQYRMTNTYRRAEADWRMVASHTSVVTRDPPAQKVSSAGWPGLAGRYRLLSDGWTFTVEWRDGKLYGGRDPKNLRELIPLTPDTFVVSGRLGEWMFVTEKGRGARIVDFRKFEPLVWTRVD